MKFFLVPWFSTRVVTVSHIIPSMLLSSTISLTIRLVIVQKVFIRYLISILIWMRVPDSWMSLYCLSSLPHLFIPLLHHLPPPQHMTPFFTGEMTIIFHAKSGALRITLLDIPPFSRRTTINLSKSMTKLMMMVVLQTTYPILFNKLSSRKLIRRTKE